MSSTGQAQSGSEGEKKQAFVLHHPLNLYDIVKVLGKGSYGLVYHAVSKRTGVNVAIKVMHINSDRHADIDSYEKEVSILQEGFARTGVVQLLETYRFEREVWLVMEYCEAGTLDSILFSRYGGTFDELTTAAVIKMLLLGLKHLHSQKLIHRDIKGANVLVNALGECKLADFGLSTVLPSTTSNAVTLCGTPYFVAPEVCLRRPYNAKADIWAIGLLAYVLLTGNVPEPIRPMRPYEVLQSIPVQPAETWQLPAKNQSATGEKLPPGTGWHKLTNSFLASCLILDPDKRWSASQLLKHPFILAVPVAQRAASPASSASSIASSMDDRALDSDDDWAGAAAIFRRVVDRCLPSIREKALRNVLTKEERANFTYTTSRGQLLEVGIKFDELSTEQLEGLVPVASTAEGCPTHFVVKGEEAAHAAKNQKTPPGPGAAAPANGNASPPVSNGNGSPPLTSANGRVAPPPPPLTAANGRAPPPPPAPTPPAQAASPAGAASPISSKGLDSSIRASAMASPQSTQNGRSLALGIGSPQPASKPASGRPGLISGALNPAISKAQVASIMTPSGRMPVVHPAARVDMNDG